MKALCVFTRLDQVREDCMQVQTYDSLILGNRNRILFSPYLVHDSNCDTKYRSTFFENFVSSDDAVSTQCSLTLLASLRERKVIERTQFTNYLNL